MRDTIESARHGRERRTVVRAFRMQDARRCREMCRETHTKVEVSIRKIVRQRGMCTDAGEACREEYERWQDV